MRVLNPSACSCFELSPAWLSRSLASATSASTLPSRVVSVALYLCTVLSVWVTVSWMVDSSARSDSANGAIKVSADGQFCGLGSRNDDEGED